MTQIPARKYAIISLACVAACFAATTVSLASPVEPEGAWVGVISSTSKTMMRVDTTFGAKRISLHFGEPANCALIAALLDGDDQTTHYRFHPSTNGGSFCTKLYPGDVTVTSRSPQAMDLTFRRSDAVWSGALRPATAP
jgi:hypothetical protein